MSKFIVNGGKKLEGTIEAGAGKNGPLAILCATLMIEGKTILKDMAHADEIERLLNIFTSIGVKHKWLDDSTLEIDTSGKLDLESIDKELSKKVRISLLFFGALAAREKKYKLYKSGGCKLGSRTVRPHILALEKLGIKVTSTPDYFEVSNDKLSASDIVMYESGDTATENAIMAAVLAPGDTTIKFASSNYMVTDLCYFLEKAGAIIEGIGTTTLKISGVKKLNEVDEYYPSPDPVDAMAWISLAITTDSTLTINNCPLDFLELELLKLEVMGQKFKIQNKRKSKNGKINIAEITIEPSELVALPDKLYGRPYPGLNIDNVPLFVPILCKAKGQSLVHDWCYENRAVYYSEFKKLGANVRLLDPHRLLIEGPTKFTANEITSPPALRPAMAILIGMLASDGESILNDPTMLERGYENVVERLSQVGADIRRVK